jgi:iron complex outermembrane receptor protein
VRVVVTGDAVPAVNIVPSSKGLMLNLTASSPETEDDEIEITVTGEQNRGYRVPNASTATRTDTAILDTPQSIQVIPQQILRDQQIIRVDQALRNVSGVTGDLGTFGSIQGLTIRGFTTDSFANTSLLRDGFRVYYNLGPQETANLEQIEVLKGPSSVLYGQNDPGGIINLVTKQPLSQPFYNLEFQAGSFGLIRPTLDLTGPLDANGNLLYRLNLAYQRSDGFRDFQTDNERFFIAPVLKWKISDRTNLTFSLEYLNDKSPADFGIPAFGRGVLDAPRDRIFGEPDDFVKTRTLSIGYNLEHQFDNNWTLRNAFRYVDQNYRISAALPIAFDEITGIFNRAYGGREYQSNDYSLQTNVVGKFETGSIKHTLLAGVDLNWSKLNDVFSKVIFEPPVPLNAFNPVYGLFPRPNFDTIPQTLEEFDIDINRTGVFIQDQIAFSDQLSLVLGLRFDTINNRDTFSGVTRFDSAWSPRIGLVYKPAEIVALFANYSQSFTPNLGQDIDGKFLEPEKAQGYEFGAKIELLNRKLFATLSYFDITKQNVATSVPPLGLFSVATGKQRSQGIEFDVSGEILPNWNVIGFYAYTNARITEDNDIPAGNRLPGSPYSSFGLWTTYQIPDGDLQGLGFGLGVNYVGNRVGDRENTFEVGDYFLTNAAIFYKRDQWRIGLNFNNLFNTNYISGVGGEGRINVNAPGAPFSVTGSVSVNF